MTTDDELLWCPNCNKKAVENINGIHGDCTYCGAGVE